MLDYCLVCLQDSLAFMFETYYTPRLTPQALGATNIDRNYYQVSQAACILYSGRAPRGMLTLSWEPVGVGASSPCARSMAATLHSDLTQALARPSLFVALA